MARCALRVARCALRVARCALRVARCALRVAGCGLRVAARCGRSLPAGWACVRFAMCCRRSIFGAGYSPRRATLLSFGEKKEGKESASIQYHGQLHVFDPALVDSLARPAGSNRGVFEGPERTVDLPTQAAAGANCRPRGGCKIARRPSPVARRQPFAMRRQSSSRLCRAADRSSRRLPGGACMSPPGGRVDTLRGLRRRVYRHGNCFSRLFFADFLF